MLRNVCVLAASALALGILVVGGWRGWTMAERDFNRKKGYWVIEDMNSLRQIVSMLASCREIPWKDGAVDPYYLVRSGEIVGSNIQVLGSKWFGKAPTEEEALRGDYANFPWERYRGERPTDGPFPLLWGRFAKGGEVLVGWSDGSVRVMEPEEFAELDLGR